MPQQQFGYNRCKNKMIRISQTLPNTQGSLPSPWAVQQVQHSTSKQFTLDPVDQIWTKSGRPTSGLVGLAEDSTCIQFFSTTCSLREHSPTMSPVSHSFPPAWLEHQHLPVAHRARHVWMFSRWFHHSWEIAGERLPWVSWVGAVTCCDWDTRYIQIWRNRTFQKRHHHISPCCACVFVMTSLISSMPLKMSISSFSPSSNTTGQAKRDLGRPNKNHMKFIKFHGGWKWWNDEMMENGGKWDQMRSTEIPLTHWDPLNLQLKHVEAVAMELSESFDANGLTAILRHRLIATEVGLRFCTLWHQ